MATKKSRAEFRLEQIATIKQVTRDLIAVSGASGFSLREVAREMGVVSSALYRYFATRDELLSALVFDAYNDLGMAVEKADSKLARSDIRGRFRATCNAVRKWAKANPHEYALIYGTPVPDYESPVGTIAAATRVAAVLGRILDDDQSFRHRTKRSNRSKLQDGVLDTSNIAQVMPGVPREEYVRALIAWSHIFGHLSFELFGHFEGTVKNKTLMFDAVVEELADFLGIK